MSNMGVLLDLKLSWESNIVALTGSSFNQLRLIAQLHPFLDGDALRTLVYALVIDYSNTFLCGVTSMGEECGDQAGVECE